MVCHSDLLIIGGGPAGLCAAINGASEGLSIRIMDNGTSLGGQAKESNAIENYPGFPVGVTGEVLMGNFVSQAERFDTKFVCPVGVVKLERDSGIIRAYSEDYQEFTADAVLISTGLSYRRLSANNLGPLMGKGVYYGAPQIKMNMEDTCCVAVVGGANSAGQAAVKLSDNPNATVYLYIRKKIEDQMSTYLINKIKDRRNIIICEGCEVEAVCGKSKLEGVVINRKVDGGDFITEAASMDYMFIFIGATPRTYWLQGTLDLDDHKYILTDQFETSMPGVFAAGDVRSGSTKRVAAACGEGVNALQQIYKYLASNRG